MSIFEIRCIIELLLIGCCRLCDELLLVLSEFVGAGLSGWVPGEEPNLIIFTTYDKISFGVLSQTPNCLWNWNRLLASSSRWVPNLDLAVVTS